MSKIEKLSYYQRNKAKCTARRSLQTDEQRAAKAQYKKEWAAKNAERLKAKRKLQYAAERSEAIAKASAWNRENKEKRAAITARYSKANPDQHRATKAVRRARIAASSGSYTKDDIKALHSLQKGLCAVCRVKLGLAYEADHIVPLARGGPNTKTNLQLLCRTCNRCKGAKDPVSFMQERGFLL